MRKNARIGLPLTIALALIVAACAGGGAASPAAPTAAAPTTEPSMAPSVAPSEPASMAPPSEAPSAPAAGGETVTVAESELGQILVDGEGNTLYLFTQDTDGESVCYDECETNWPPLTVDGEITVGGGLDASLFSTVARTDGSMQVKIGEWPLYYFAADAAAGDTNGQGVGGVWFVVSPTGEMIE